MPAWLLSIVKLLPGVGKIFESLGQGSNRVRELRAEAELEEAKAFRAAGRIGPTLLRRYVLVGIWVVVVIAMLIAIFVPNAVNIDWESAIRAGRGLMELWESD